MQALDVDTRPLQVELSVHDLDRRTATSGRVPGAHPFRLGDNPDRVLV
jgi:hypothetical protein